MVRINLLPWRETLRKKRQRNLGMATLGALTVTLLAGFYIHLHVQRMIDYQESRNSFLKKEIVEMGQKIKAIKDLGGIKAKLLARMEIIQQLQSSRPQIVHLFDELVKITPQDTFLTKVTQTGNSVTIEGQAQSNTRISAYMRNIDASAWLEKPALQVIKQGNKTSTELSHFTLTVQQLDAARKGAREGER